MTLKGAYNPETTYEVGDVVIYTDEVVYNLQHPCPAGVPPVDSRYWGRLNQILAEAVRFIRDAVLAMKDEIEEDIPKNIDDESIVLKSGDDEYLISVDATGDTPEVVAELIVPDEGEGD